MLTAGVPRARRQRPPLSDDVESSDAKRRGFFLQVEGAQIDKRSHVNDAAQTLGEVKAFDDAVATAHEFAKRDRNTLVIVTADHECAGFNIIGKSSFTNAEAVAPPTNQSGTSSTQTPVRASGNTRDTTRSTGPVNGSGSADPKNFAPATFRSADDPAGVTDGSPDASLWLSYLSGNHTGADVPLYSYGPGSSRFVGRQDNTDLYRDMIEALHVKVAS
jgi:alkaline phosphatase